MTMSHQIENNNQEIEIFKRNKMEILELKTTKIEIKNSLEMLHQLFELAKNKFVNLKIG